MGSGEPCILACLTIRHSSHPNKKLLKVKYAKEDFDSDDWGRKRAVIKRLGASLKLSGRTIMFAPVKYLVLVAENHATLEAKKEAARTAPQQMKKGLKEGQNEVWWGLINQVLLIYKEHRGGETTTSCA